MSDKGKRTIALAGIILALIVLSIYFRIQETSHRMGLPVVKERVFFEKYQDLPQYEALENAQSLLFFNGNLIPYDKSTNTFYLTQNINNSNFEGLLRLQSDIIKAWWINDEYKDKKNAAIENNHPYEIAVTDGKAVSVLRFVLTGLPVVSISAEEIVKIPDAGSDEYTDGNISVWSAVDEDYGMISDRSSIIHCKQSPSEETITFKIRDKQNENNKRVSLLSLGKYDAWKLYKVKENDKTCIRMSTAIQLWNECCSTDELKIPYRFVEVILNNSYQGLYILCPRTDDDYFNLSDDEMIIRTEELNDKMEIYKNYCPDNLSDFALWYQAVNANTYIFGDLVIIRNKDNKTLFLPGKMEYVFGDFPNQNNWRSWGFQDRVINADEFDWPEEAKIELENDLKARWIEARNSFLEDDELRSYGDTVLETLKETGIAKRRMLEEDTISDFVDGLISRYSIVDRYYESKEN